MSRRHGSILTGWRRPGADSCSHETSPSAGCAPASDAADESITTQPEFSPTLRSGLRFLLPVGALIWNLVGEQLAPTRAAFRATLLLALIVLTQRPLLAWFRGEAEIAAAARPWRHQEPGAGGACRLGRVLN